MDGSSYFESNELLMFGRQPPTEEKLNRVSTQVSEHLEPLMMAAFYIPLQTAHGGVLKPLFIALKT